jgi:hypothetical protein
MEESSFNLKDKDKKEYSELLTDLDKFRNDYMKEICIKMLEKYNGDAVKALYELSRDASMLQEENVRYAWATSKGYNISDESLCETMGLINYSSEAYKKHLDKYLD